MRISTVALTVGLIAASSSMPTLAGQPDDPGAGGQVNGEVKDLAAALGVTPGEVKQTITDAFDENFGQLKKEAVPEGRPNPANDNGGGNGP